MTVPGKSVLSRPDTAWPGALFLAVVYLLTTGWGFQSQPIANPDEPRYTCPARDMVEGRGSWLVPVFNDEPRLKKPPLIYWALAVCGKAGQAAGLDLSSSFRLAALLAGLATLLFVYGLGRRLWSPRAGLLASLLFIAMPYLHEQHREIDTDPFLNAALTGAWYFYVVALERLRTAASGIPVGALLGLYLSLGAACLTKGPFLTGVFFVLPAALYLLWDRARALPQRGLPAWLVWRTGLLWGVPLALALGMGWNLLLSQSGLGEQGKEVLVHENLLRFLGGVDHNKGLQMYPWAYYLQNVPSQFLPWSLFWIPLVVVAWREHRAALRRSVLAAAALLAVVLILRVLGGPHPEQNWEFKLYLGLAVGLGVWAAVVSWWWARGQQVMSSHARLLCCAVGVPFLLMGLAGSKRPSYLLPVFPFLVLWTAQAWDVVFLRAAAGGAARPRVERAWGLLTGALAVAAAVAAVSLAVCGLLGWPKVLTLAPGERAAAVLAAIGLVVAAVWALRELAGGARERAVVQVLLMIAVAGLAHEAAVRPALDRRADRTAFYAELSEMAAGRPLVWLGGTANEVVWYCRQPVNRLTSYGLLKEEFFAVPNALLVVRHREFGDEPDPRGARESARGSDSGAVNARRMLREAVRELRTTGLGDTSYHFVEADPARPPDPALFNEAPTPERRAGGEGE